MKKIKTGVLFFLCMAMIFLCSSCGNNQEVSVDTLLTLDSSGAGSRTMTCHFSVTGSGSETAAQLDGLIAQYCPSMLTYSKMEEGDNLSYQFQLDFSSYQDYLEKITQLLGRKPVIIFSFPDNIFTTGSRISEDFESGDLFSWLYASISLEELQGSLSPRFSNGSTAVSLDGRTQTTSSRIALNRTQGSPLDAIFVDTVNRGDGTFDRTIVFRIPLTTVHDLGDDLEPYMNARTDSLASSAQWTDYISGREYAVTFQGLSLEELSRCTNLLFNSRFSGTIFSEEHSEHSTPFVDASLFTETIDLSSYTGEQGKNIPLYYRYSSQSSRTLAGGETYKEGSWHSAGDVSDGVFQYESRASLLNIRISEQTEHQALGTTITLSCLGDGRFQRDVDFLFDAQDITGVQYALDYLQSKGSGAEIRQDTADEGLLCRVSTQGTAEEISREMSALFGEQNVMKYAREGGSVEVHHTTRLTDIIYMEHLFTGINQGIPITYRIQTNGKEQLYDVQYTSETHSSSVSLAQEQDGALQFSLDSGDTVIEYNGYTSNNLGIFLVFLAVICVIAGVIILIFFIRKRGGGSTGKKQDPSLVLYDPEEPIEDILADI